MSLSAPRHGRTRLIALWLATVAACTQSPARLLPAEAGGYRPAGEDGLFTAETLFDLIDGGAEVYRSLNVRRVASRRYAKPGADEIVLDIFDMGSPADAFGAYHHDIRGEPSAGIGRESELDGNVLAFWKDRYFVSIVAFDDSAETQAAMQALGSAVAAGIPGDGKPPELLAHLPRDGLVTSHVSYFHDWSYLRTRISLGRENVLGLEDDCEGLLARYRVGPETAVLLLVRYPTTNRAARALERLAEHRERADGRVRGRLLAVVLDAASEAVSRRLLDAVEEVKE